MGVLSCFLLFHYCACKWRTPRIPREFSSSVSFIRSPSAPKTSQHPTHHGQGTTAQPPVAKDPLHLLLSQPFPATSALAAAAPLNPSTSAWLRGTTAKQPNKPKQLVLIRTLACFDNALNLHVGTAGVFFFLGKCVHLCSTQQLNPLFSSWKGFFLAIRFLMDSKSLAAVCCLGWKCSHTELGVPPKCAMGTSHASQGAPKMCRGMEGSPSSCPCAVCHGCLVLPAPLQAVAKFTEFKGISCSLSGFSFFQQET